MPSVTFPAGLESWCTDAEESNGCNLQDTMLPIIAYLNSSSLHLAATPDWPTDGTGNDVIVSALKEAGASDSTVSNVMAASGT